MTDLTLSDLDTIKTALDFAVRRVEEYGSYPSYEYKQQRIGEINVTRNKVLELRKIAKARDDEGR